MAGTLTDAEIIDRCSNGQLITESFKPENIKQACYELRASNTYYEVYNNNKRHDVTNNQYILLKPKECLVLITKERLELPRNILGRILTKGKLFSIGISAVNTYADPGFQGRLGIVLINLSNSYLKIIEGQAIAKIEFSELDHDVTRPYTGQHGYETEIWPVPVEMKLSPKEIASDPRILSDVEEIRISHGDTMAKYMKTVFLYERRILLFTFATMAVFFLLILFMDTAKASKAFIDTSISAAIGFLTSILASIAFYLATRKQP